MKPQTANKKVSSHRCCSCRWARPRLAPPALPSWPPSTSPSSSLLQPRPLPGRPRRRRRRPAARRRSPRPRPPRPGRRRRCCPTACCCPPRRGGCGCRSGSAPRSLSCCSRKCCNRKCCSRRCCSRKCRRTHSRSLAVCGRRRRRLLLLRLSSRCWSRPPRSPGRRARSSSGPCGLLRPPAAGSAQTGVRWTGCVGACGGSRDRDTRGPAGGDGDTFRTP